MKTSELYVVFVLIEDTKYFYLYDGLVFADKSAANETKKDAAKELPSGYRVSVETLEYFHAELRKSAEPEFGF